MDNDNFTTTTGLKGYVVSVEIEHSGQKVYQRHYFFGKGKRKYVVTYTREAGKHLDIDKKVDKALSTFNIQE